MDYVNYSSNWDLSVCFFPILRKKQLPVSTVKYGVYCLCVCSCFSGKLQCKGGVNFQ